MPVSVSWAIEAGGLVRTYFLYASIQSDAISRWAVFRSNWPAHTSLWSFLWKRIFHIGVPGRRFGRLGPKVTNGIRSSQRQRNQVVNFVIAGLVLRDSILGVRLSFKPCRHRPHLLCVARNAH